MESQTIWSKVNTKGILLNKNWPTLVWNNCYNCSHLASKSHYFATAKQQRCYKLNGSSILVCPKSDPRIHFTWHAVLFSGCVVYGLL